MLGIVGVRIGDDGLGDFCQASVLIADRDVAAAEKRADVLAANGAAVSALGADVTDWTANQAMVSACVERFGALDILAANAGLGQRPCRLEETSDEEYERQFDVNVRGVFYGCRAALPQFRKQRSGCIIVTVSGIALRPRPNHRHNWGRVTRNRFS